MGVLIDEFEVKELDTLFLGEREEEFKLLNACFILIADIVFNYSKQKSNFQEYKYK
jgi:hypothetical protein